MNTDAKEIAAGFTRAMRFPGVVLPFDEIWGPVFFVPAGFIRTWRIEDEKLVREA